MIFIESVLRFDQIRVSDRVFLPFLSCIPSLWTAYVPLGCSCDRHRQAPQVILERLAKPVAVAVIIGLGKETGFAVLTALHDVQWQTVKVDAGAAEHELSQAN